MKKLWLAALAGLAFTSSALAADLGQPAAPLYKEPPPPPPPAWTGLYVGVNGGWGFNQRTGRSDALGVGNILKPNGGLAGGQIGYNWQNGIVVYGFETDIQWADIHDADSAVDGFGDVYSASQKLDWFGTARARLGITAWGDNALLYVTGGLIYGQQKVAASFDDAVTHLSSAGGSTMTRTGGTIGAGLEYKFTPSVSGKIEGLWYSMGSTTLGLPATAADIGPIDAHFRFTGAIVRAGLNFHFNSGDYGGGFPGPGQ